VHKELIKNTGIYLASSLISQGLVFVLWIILGHRLAPAEIGLYSLAMFIIEFFSVLSMFGLENAVTRFYYSTKTVPCVLSNTVLIFIPATLFSIGLFSVLKERIVVWIPGLAGVIHGHFALLIMIIIANSCANLSFIHFSALKRAMTHGKLLILRFLAFFVCSLILVWRGFGAAGLLYSQLCSLVLVSLIFIRKEGASITHKEYCPESLKEVAAYSFPLMLYAVFGVFITYFSRILLDRFTNLSTLGVYSFFLTFVLQINGMWGNFNRAWTPEVFSGYAGNRQAILVRMVDLANLLSFVYLAVMAVVVLLGWAGVFTALFKPVYLESIGLFYILLLAPLFVGLYTILYPLFYYDKRTSLILLSTVIMTGLELCVTLVLVKLYRETGAAVSYVIVQLIILYVYMAVFRRVLRFPSGILRLCAALIGITGIGSVVLLWLRSQLLFFAVMALGAAFVYKTGAVARRKQAFIAVFTALKEKIINGGLYVSG
jgi:O-antigen/teichoic acid export membrane protein